MGGQLLVAPASDAQQSDAVDEALNVIGALLLGVSASQLILSTLESCLSISQNAFVQRQEVCSSGLTDHNG
jgi:hypothetical protein